VLVTPATPGDVEHQAAARIGRHAAALAWRQGYSVDVLELLPADQRADEDWWVAAAPDFTPAETTPPTRASMHGRRTAESPLVASDIFPDRQALPHLPATRGAAYRRIAAGRLGLVQAGLVQVPTLS
jgi:hypothetical protein